MNATTPTQVAASAQELRILSTREAADLLARKPATLRRWAALGCGPINPIRICGRLGWRTQDVSNLLRGAV